MRKLIIYNIEDNKTYQYPNGALATPERVLSDYPAIATFKHIIETDEFEQMFIGIQNLAMARTMYNVDKELYDEEAVLAIQDIMNTQDETAINTPSAEERIASALEYQVMMSMPDVEEI